MLGRQLFMVSPLELAALLKKNNMWPQGTGTTYEEFARKISSSKYCEPFLTILGAQQINVLDFSAYEGADIIHNLNQPISPEWHRQFDCIIDGGTLEHVFNFPIAIRNCMEMVKRGGHLILCMAANNNLGHGFYQFSPDLLYRTLSPENGFRIKRLLALDCDVLYTGDRWYEFTDQIYSVLDEARLGVPAQAVKTGLRVLRNCRPVVLFALAQRTDVVELFRLAPVQSEFLPQPSAENSDKAASGAWKFKFSLIERVFLKVMTTIIKWLNGKDDLVSCSEIGRRFRLSCLKMMMCVMRWWLWNPRSTFSKGQSFANRALFTRDDLQ